MFKPKKNKCTTSVTLEKPSQEKPFVQVEGELTEEQLEAIALRALAFANRGRGVTFKLIQN